MSVNSNAKRPTPRWARFNLVVLYIFFALLLLGMSAGCTLYGRYRASLQRDSLLHHLHRELPVGTSFCDTVFCNFPVMPVGTVHQSAFAQACPEAKVLRLPQCGWALLQITSSGDSVQVKAYYPYAVNADHAHSDAAAAVHATLSATLSALSVPLQQGRLGKFQQSTPTAYTDLYRIGAQNHGRLLALCGSLAGFEEPDSLFKVFTSGGVQVLVAGSAPQYFSVYPTKYYLNGAELKQYRICFFIVLTVLLLLVLGGHRLLAKGHKSDADSLASDHKDSMWESD